MDVTITCGTGTYIRALARDLGRASGSAAHLTSLRRIRSGEFDVADAVSIENLKLDPPALRELKVIALPPV
jgi:tRNA pseudouridine55 synthase